MVLSKTKLLAERHLGRLAMVQYAVITVPSQFNDAQRQAVKDACTIAGLQTRFITEPLAASLGFGLHNRKSITSVVVFTLGSGSLSVAFQHIGNGIIKTLATSGSTKTGLQSVDDALVALVRPVASDLSPAELAQLRRQCRNAKHALLSSTKESYAVSVAGTKVAITWNQLNSASRSLKRTITQALQDLFVEAATKDVFEFEWSREDVNEVFLVGAGAPVLRPMVREYFRSRVAIHEINQDVVVRGAALRAAMLGELWNIRNKQAKCGRRT
eukprot:TRINITY_DN23205_c0_g3_i1.p1 TRINITY_DN23205_c0_g3~~TRINITY_DN23205_c0_g3_i1.p1  ORF type:complete len:271 (-),score=39.46 TRINITY_DN23205_c0_g3_i1:72-884(-)